LLKQVMRGDIHHQWRKRNPAIIQHGAVASIACFRITMQRAKPIVIGRATIDNDIA